MKEYHQLYKCRLCGELFTNGAATCNKELANEVTMQLATVGKAKDFMAGGLLSYHKCTNEVSAIGDFVGWQVKEID